MRPPKKKELGGRGFKSLSAHGYMIVTPIRTRLLIPPKDDLMGAIRASLKSLPERSVLVVASKVVSIWQGRCVPIEKYPHKDDLIKQEADRYLPGEYVRRNRLMHTIKNNLFIPSAGIDESNAAGHYILWPRNPKRAAAQIHHWAKKTYGVKELGVIIADSYVIPLRRGALGISLAHYGFFPLKDYKGENDLFGRRFTMTQTNIVDALAAAAVLVMGEGAERTPLALIRNLPLLRFISRPTLLKKKFSSLEIKEKEEEGDLYYPLLSAVPWKKGGGGKFKV